MIPDPCRAPIPRNGGLPDVIGLALTVGVVCLLLWITGAGTELGVVIAARAGAPLKFNRRGGFNGRGRFNGR